MGFKLGNTKTWGKSLIATVGIGESRGWSTLLLVMTIIGLVPNFVVLIGCMVPQTRSIYLFRVSSMDMIDATANITKVGTKSLDIAELPDHWYWGLSGLCAVHRNDEVACQRSFPPLYTVEEMMSFGIESHPGTKQEDVKHLMAPWTKALGKLSSDLTAKHDSFTAFIRVTAALTVVSTILAIALAGLGFASLTFWHGKPARWMLYMGAFADACMFTAAGVMAIFAMNHGPRAVIEMSGIEQGNERTFVGPGFFVLFAGAFFKLISIGVFFILAFSAVLLVVFLVYCCIGRKKKDRDLESDEIPITGYPEQKTYAQ